MRLSERVSSVKRSATAAVTEKAAALRARGIGVVDLGAGEPDFAPAPHVLAAAERAIREGRTRYTPVGGTPELKTAVVEKLRRDNGLDYDITEVMASCGGKHVLYLAFQALFGPGEEVLLPAPYWVSYRDMLTLAGARARVIRGRLERGFKLTPDELEEAITPRSRGIILNSPSNPAGVTYTRSELENIAEVLARHDLVIICDDVYEMITYGKAPRAHLLTVRPELRERTVVVNSVSKTYAMTGWRIGYSAGPRPLIESMATLQGQMTSNPCSVAQAAAAAALRGEQHHVVAMVREFERRRDFVVARLNAIERIDCPCPDGAFYVFPNVGAYLRPSEGIRNGDDLADFLLNQVQVALVGGTDFGYPEHVRISFATSMENLREGMERIEKGLTMLARGEAISF